MEEAQGTFSKKYEFLPFVDSLVLGFQKFGVPLQS